MEEADTEAELMLFDVAGAFSLLAGTGRNGSRRTGANAADGVPLVCSIRDSHHVSAAHS